MAMMTVETNSCSYQVRDTGGMSEHDVALRIARRLGHRQVKVCQGSGDMLDVNMGYTPRGRAAMAVEAVVRMRIPASRA